LINLNIYERAKKEAKYIIEKKSTVRQTAEVFNISKSTVYKDVTKVLNENHDPLEGKCAEVLEINKEQRHLRGGEATKQKYLKLKYWFIF